MKTTLYFFSNRSPPPPARPMPVPTSGGRRHHIALPRHLHPPPLPVNPPPPLNSSTLRPRPPPSDHPPSRRRHRRLATPARPRPAATLEPPPCPEEPQHQNRTLTRSYASLTTRGGRKGGGRREAGPHPGWRRRFPHLTGGRLVCPGVPVIRRCRHLGIFPPEHPLYYLPILLFFNTFSRKFVSTVLRAPGSHCSNN